MLSCDDALIDYTEEHGQIGLALGYANLLPHFLYPAKPNVSFGNLYARRRECFPRMARQLVFDSAPLPMLIISQSGSVFWSVLPMC